MKAISDPVISEVRVYNNNPAVMEARAPLPERLENVLATPVEVRNKIA